MKTSFYSAFALLIGLAISSGSFAQTDEAEQTVPQEDFAAEDFAPIAKCGCCTQGGAQQTSPVILALDLDKDGQISTVEIKNAVQSLSALDADGDGNLTRSEMHPNTVSTNTNSENVAARKMGITRMFLARKMLKMYDQNGDDQLEIVEMSDAMLAILPKIDRDGDEILSVDELKKISQSIKEYGARKVARQAEEKRKVNNNSVRRNR